MSFNALKNGRYAARSARLRERLIRAGYERQEELYGRIRSKIAQTFGTPDRTGRQDADRLANVVWCRATRPEASQGSPFQPSRPQSGGPTILTSQACDPQNAGFQAGRPVDLADFPATGSPHLTEAGREASMGTKLESLTIQTDSLCRVPSGQRESAGPAAGAAEGKVAQRSPDGQLKGRPKGQEGLNSPKHLRRHRRLGRHASPGNPASLGCHLGGEPAVVRFKFGAQDDWRRIGLTFWVQRKAYCTLERGVRVLVGREKPAPPEWNEYLERTVRSRAFRLRKPNPRERWRFSLGADGKPDWTREPWKSVRARVEAQDQTRRRQRR
ncbi:MAG TPA: hypothetical protein VI455_11305 [Terriglobia bacterium]